MTREEMKELNGLAASMGLHDDKNPCKRAVILGRAIKELEQEPCSDAVSRQAVLDMMQMRISGKELYKAIYDLPPVTFDDAIKALEQELCGDAISRAYIEPIIEELENICVNGDERILDLLADIKNAPPVTPQQETRQYENSEILDKIRTEIEFEVDHRTNMICAEDVFEIIDKYMAEIKDKEIEEEREI